jgi:hypothetical protein
MKRPFLASLYFLVAMPFAGASLAGPPVLIEPVRAEISKTWLQDIKDSRARPGAIRELDARKMADDMAKSFQAALDRALREQGFQVVASPLPDTVRLSARLDDVYVTAPENSASGVRSYARTAGHATLNVQARDAAGALLLQAEERSDAGDLGRLQRATDVSNQFWFDALFQDWSRDLARDLRQKAR